MKNRIKISGTNVKNIIEQLYKNKSFIKIKLPNSDCEILSVVTNLRVFNNKSFIAIDQTPDFMAALTINNDSKELFIEFSGEDGISYDFKSNNLELDYDSIWIEFPEFVYRYQKRDDFRVSTPDGAKIIMADNTLNSRFSLVDISLGGALIKSIKKKQDHSGNLRFSIGETLDNFKLVIPLKAETVEINIKEAQVVRSFRQKKIFIYYGLYFNCVNSTEKQTLVKVIYEIQRFFLANRIKTIQT